MIYADKNGDVVQVGCFVTIPNFPEYADKYYEITKIDDNTDMYEITEVDDNTEFIPNTTINIEPWKIQTV